MSRKKGRNPAHKTAGTSPKTTKGAGVRILAARLLSKWQEATASDRPPLNILIQDAACRLTEGAPEDRALLGELVTGTVRHLRLLTCIADTRLKKPAKLPSIVKTIITTALYQLLFLDRIPAFAAVDEAVKACRCCGAAWASGLVNAVLRRILRDIDNQGRDGLISAAAKQGRDAAERLAIIHSYPTWMVNRWGQQFGMDTAEQICRAGNQHPPVTLRVNRLKISRKKAIEQMNMVGIHAVASTISLDGLILPDFRGNPASIPGFEKGYFQVQDESAQLISLLLNPRPDERILDVCAGLGGKTTHIAEITGDKARIDAYDTSRKRLKLLAENISRLQLKSISILNHTDFHEKKAFAPVYDRIMVDAPCTGLGVIRRHPDIKWNRTHEDSHRLSETQLKILLDAAPLLRTGGTMVYAVCTTEDKEGVEVAKKFLELGAGSWELVRVDHATPDIDLNICHRYITDQGFLRILPAPQGPDGFFAAVFRKKLIKQVHHHHSP